MSYFKNINVQASDSPSIDAFGRWRVSQVTTQFDAKQLHDSLPLFIDTETIGTGTASHSATFAHSSLATSASSDVVILQTKQRFNYQSGKSQLLFWTFNGFDVETNVTKYIGYYSTGTASPFNSDLDGFYLQSDGTTLGLRVYRSGTNTGSADRASWDDPLDGTGPSGITHDFDNNTILAADFEWLGVGRIRFYVVKNGVFIKFHEFDYTDTTSVYMSSPNQPLRWEMRQGGAGSGSMNVICSSVNSEGAINLLGKIISENLGVSAVNANTVGTNYALLGIRLKTDRVDTLIDLIDYSVLSITADNQLIQLWLNPTVAGTFTYNDITDSSVQIAKGDTSANPSTTTVTGGTLLFSQYISGQVSSPVSIENAIRLGMSIAGVCDEIVITTTPLTSNADVTGSITWRELT